MDDGPQGTKAELLNTIMHYFGMTGIRELRNQNPGKMELILPSGNIFRNNLEMKVVSPAGKKIDVSIYDITGRLIKNIFSGKGDGSVLNLSWNGMQRSGIYFIRMKSGNNVLTKKVIEIR